MPAQGRGAFLTPRAPAKAPPKPAPKPAPRKASPTPSTPTVLVRPRPTSHVFSEPLSHVTQRNYRTGGQIQALVAAGKLKPVEHHNIFDKALKTLGAGEHDLEGGVAKALDLLHIHPGTPRDVPLSVEAGKEANRRAAKVFTQAAEVGGLGVAGKALTLGGRGLAASRDTRALEELASGARPSLGAAAGRTAGSLALRGAGGAATGYAKLMVAAAPAEAASKTTERPMSPNEPFASHFWKSAVETIANLPAATIEGVKHPVKTAEGLLSMYEHPKKAFQENPFGTILAFLGPARAADRLAGASIRGASGGRILSTDRPALQARPGIISQREWDRGLVGGTAQRVPDRVMKGLGKGEKPVGAPANVVKVSGRRFAKTMAAVRKNSPLHAENLTPHEASHYKEAWLTRDGKAGVATVDTGRRLPDGRPEVELVNLFNSGDVRGVGHTLEDVATKAGANKLDALEGYLTERYASRGWKVVKREPWDPAYGLPPKLAGAEGPQAGVAYHGSGTPPSTILKEGLTKGGGNEGSGIYLIGDHRLASVYTPEGGYLYRVNTKGTPVEGQLGESVLRREVGPNRIQLVPETKVHLSRADLAKLNLPKALHDKLDTVMSSKSVTAEEARTIVRVLGPHADYEQSPALHFLRKELQDFLKEHDAAAKQDILHMVHGGHEAPTLDTLSPKHPELIGARPQELNSVRKAQGKPNETVTIYRLSTRGEIKPGHEVSLQKPDHAVASHLKLVEKQVPARDLTFNPHELGDRDANGQLQFVYRPHGKEILQATKRQTKKMVGGGMAGVIRPSHVDMLEGGRKLAHNLETMKRRDFLARALGVPFKEKIRDRGKEALRTKAVMAFHEGVARTPDSFWSDIAERVAHLKYVQRGRMNPEDRRLNEAQVKNLEDLEQNRKKLDPEILADAAEHAGHIARYQVEDWKLLNREGVGLPGQLAARFVPPLLMHGHLMGRGELKFNENPGPHPITDRIHELEKAREQTKKDIGILRAEIRGRAVPKGVKQGHHFRKEAAEDQLLEQTQQLKDLHEQLNVARATGQADHRGHLYPGVYDEAGARISAAEAEAFIKEHYGREIGFLTHRQERVAAGQGSFGQRTTYPMRTGSNFLAGAYDNSPNALREHFDRVAHNLAEKRNARQVAQQLVMGKGTDEHGQTVWYENQHEAEDAAKGFNASAQGAALADHLGKLKAFNVGPKKVADLMEPHHNLLSQAGQIEGLALSEEHGNWGVAPADVVDRFREWEKTEDKIRNSKLKLLTTPWRRTNLYTSTRWPIGVTQENAIRVAAAHASPLVVLPYLKHTSLSWLTGDKVTGYLDQMIQDHNVPQEQKDLAVFHRSMLGQGGFIGAQLRNTLEGVETIFPKGSDAERRLQSIPGQHAAATLWNGWTHWVGNGLAKMEQNSKEAAAGKLAKGDQTFFQRLKDLRGEEAAANYAHKLTHDPIASIHQAQKLIEIMGNYTHLTPTTRSAQATWAPFSLWWLNSARFIFKTMPKDHPYATSLLTAMVYATHSENRPLKRYLDGSVALDLPLLGKIRLTSPLYYSPYGIAEQPANTAAEMVLPQAFEPLAQMKGIDPLTNKPYDEFGEGSEGVGPGHAAFGAIGNFVPGARIAESLLRQGGHEGPHTIFPWEATNKVGLLRAAAKTFLPFKYQEERAATTKERKKKAKAKSSEFDVGTGASSEFDINK